MAAACGGGGSSAQDPADSDTGQDTELVTVTKQDVAETKRFTAVVGYGDVLTSSIWPGSTITWAPAQNSVLSPGDTAIMLANRPVVLAEGEVPMYREMRLVPFFQQDRAGNPVGRLTGPDVEQFQAFLIDQGFDDDGQLANENEFGPSTDRAAREWQASVGIQPDGIVNANQIFYVTGNIRVDSNLTVGQPLTEFNYTGTDVVLTVDHSTADRRFLTVDDTVAVQAGDTSFEGTVTRSTRVLDASGNAIQRVLVNVAIDDPDALGQTVDVFGTWVGAADALSVPVRALIATEDGGWAVEVAAGDGETSRQAVELIQVVGTAAIVAGVEEGTDVVVPI